MERHPGIVFNIGPKNSNLVVFVRRRFGPSIAISRSMRSSERIEPTSWVTRSEILDHGLQISVQLGALVSLKTAGAMTTPNRAMRLTILDSIITGCGSEILVLLEARRKTAPIRPAYLGRLSIKNITSRKLGSVSRC